MLYKCLLQWHNQDFECGGALVGSTDEISPGGETHSRISLEQLFKVVRLINPVVRLIPHEPYPSYATSLLQYIFKQFLKYLHFHLKKQAIYGYTKARFLLELTTTQIHSELTDVYRSGEVSYRMICFRIRRFLNGQESLDDPSVERPISSIVQ